MALNPYTLYHLYEKGILPYVPEDLMSGVPVSPMGSISNPYLELAQQGGLYQNHGMYNDTFQMNGAVQSPYASQPANPVPSQVQIGMLSNAGGMNTFNGVGIGGYSQAGGMNVFNGVDVGGYNQSGGSNIFGGFAGVGNEFNGFADGYNKTVSLINRTPKFVLGLAAAAIGILGVKHAFKFGRKAKPSGTGSVLSKLNPKNWGWFGKKS